jgi:predicted Fe-Mo cluster-binding NifX family protein
MKIAITSSGESLESRVDPRFGRAAKFIVLDTESGEIQATDNIQNLNAAQGAGIQAAEAVFRLGVESVVTGHCGPKAFQALTAAGIKVYTGAQGTVEEAIEAFKAGNLSAAESADVEGHWA